MRTSTSVLTLALGGLAIAGAWHLGRAQASGARGERRRTPVAAAVAHAAPAVVSVDALRSGRRTQIRSSGAGVIVHPDGLVVTNSHVVSGGQTFQVELFGGRGVHPAQLVAEDPGNDLAILKIQGGGPFRHVSLCPTRELMLGETAIAIGNPHGLGDTITVGVVSALGRQAKMANGVALGQLIQTDASINTGNSGGALLNLDGELIGINVSLLPSAQGIAFAICADQVASLLQRATGRQAPPNPLPARGTPGLTPTAPDPEPPARAEVPPPSTSRPGGGPLAPAPRVSPAPPARVQPAPVPAPAPRSTPLRPEDLGFSPEDNGSRVVIVRVDRGSAASISGMCVGDIVLSIDGRPVESAVDLLFTFSASRPGREYFLTVRRGVQVAELTLVAPR